MLNSKAYINILHATQRQITHMGCTTESVVFKVMVSFQAHSAIDVLREGVAGTKYDPMFIHIGNEMPKTLPITAP